ncbi:MAG: leucine-rich repeat protein [Bacteroidaceae bacterium]|nr:leucine-rich repeat protein [Bacteroidaceae bacterium]
MKKLLTLLFALFALSYVQAQETENKCGDNLTWSYDEATSTLTIAGDGAMYDYSSISETPWYGVKNDIKAVKFTGSPTNIGNFAFNDCYYITNVVIPSSVTSIGESAFAGSDIASLEIPNSVKSIGATAFQRCHLLESVTIPEGVTSIGEGAFSSCFGLISVGVPSTVTSFGDGIFEQCYLLKSVTIAKGVTNIVNYMFSGCKALTNIDIPSSVTNIGNYALSGCKALESIEIPATVTSIGKGAFRNCGLTSVKFLASVTSISENTFYGCTALTSIKIPEGVTSIGSYALSGCTSLTSVEIPEGVTSIAEYALSGCSALTSIEIPDGMINIDSQAFADCTGLTSIKLSSSLTSIGSYALSGCTSLTSVEIPEGVTSIATGVFSGSNALVSIVVDEKNTVYDSRENCNAIIETATNTLVAGCNATTIPTSVKSIAAGALNGFTSLTSIKIPDGVTSIDNSAFAGCTGLTSVEIPKSVTSIGNYAFDGCTGLTSVSISDGVTSIGIYAFGDCTGLTSIEIPSSVTNIDYGAFAGCTGLTSIKIPASVTSIGDVAFFGCTGLESIVVDEENTVYDSRDNCNAIIETATNKLIKGCNTTTIPTSVTSIYKDALSLCAGFESITIPESVTSIGANAFYGCTGLESITIPGSVTSIGPNTFYGCTGLTNVKIAQGLKSISNSMFNGCTGLVDIEIPNGLTTIEHYAFQRCSSLTSFKIPASVTSIGSSVFYGCDAIKSIISLVPADNLFVPGGFSGIDKTTCALFVPSGASEKYAATNYWKDFKNIIEIDGQCGDNLYWSFDEASGVLIIGGVGAMNDYSSSSRAPWYDSRENIKEVKILSDVTSVGANALSGCTAIKTIISLTAADKLLAPGSSAFEGVSKENCTIYVSKGSKSKYATTEQWKDFANVVEFEGWCGDELYWALDDETGTLSIYGEGAMYDYDYNSDAPWYNNRKNIKAINFIGAPTSIGSRAFYYCENFSSIEIPETVTSIGDNAFSYCYSLSSVNIPASVTSIGKNVFYTCHGIASIVVDEENTVYDSRENCNAIIETATNTLKVGCWSTVFPEGIVNIENYALYNCYGLRNIHIPASVKSIGEFAFYVCIGVTSIVVDEGNTVYDSRDNCNGLIETATNKLLLGCKFTVIPESVTSIGDRPFYGCSTLTDITIPANITSIGDYAFYNCIALTNIVSHIPAEDLFSVASWTFGGIDKVACTLYVPYGAKEAYAATDGWKDFTNIVEAYELTVSAAGYATMYLDKAVQIPEGVEAYIANRVEGDRLKMQALEGVIPANTAVIIKADEGTYLFAYSDESPEAISDNLLRGTLTDTYVKPASAQIAYVLSNVDGVVGMYRAKLNADGTFKNNANRAYMLLSELGVGEGDLDTSNPGSQLSNSYRFDFSGTTAIEGIDSEQGEAVYYDLSGRRVLNPTGGIYIVNGKKVYVK